MRVPSLQLPTGFSSPRDQQQQVTEEPVSCRSSSSQAQKKSQGLQRPLTSVQKPWLSISKVCIPTSGSLLSQRALPSCQPSLLVPRHWGGEHRGCSPTWPHRAPQPTPHKGPAAGAAQQTELALTTSTTGAAMMQRPPMTMMATP